MMLFLLFGLNIEIFGCIQSKQQKPSRGVLCKKDLLKDLVKFTGKHLVWRPFQAKRSPANSFIKDAVASVFMYILRIF